MTRILRALLLTLTLLFGVAPSAGAEPIHVQNIGWLAWVGDGQTCGTTGKSLRLEAVQLRLSHA